MPKVFPVKDGHSYIVVSTKPINNRYYIYNHLTKTKIEHGAVKSAVIKIRFNYADLTLGKTKKVLKNLHRQRHVVLP